MKKLICVLLCCVIMTATFASCDKGDGIPFLTTKSSTTTVKNTVTVTYNYKSEWVVDKYTIETKLLSINTAGTWTGYGDDHYYLGDFDDDFFTLEIDKLRRIAICTGRGTGDYADCER